MSSSATVSIVIASYNSASFLPATIGSCLEQTHPAHEVIVIDDGSTDETSAVCAGFGARIIYERVDNGGVSRARNIGARRSTAEWLIFLDSDDILRPTAVADLLRTVQAAKAGVAYGMVLQRERPGQLPKLNGFDFCAGPPVHSSKKNFRRCAIITPGSAIVRRSLHEQVGGFVTGYEPMEDRDFWIKCGYLEPVAYCDTVVLDKTWREGSAGSNDAKRIYRSFWAQKYLRPWCAARGLDFSWAGTDADFARDALLDALYWRADSVLAALCEQCAAHGYGGFWLHRARLRIALLRLLGRLPAEPAWVPVRPVLP
jgi:glycosyltransferase involved in cell wall biosynthesis